MCDMGGGGGGVVKTSDNDNLINKVLYTYFNNA